MTDYMTLLESALDSLPDGFALFDEEGRLALWNSAAEAVTGYSAADLKLAALPIGFTRLIDDSSPHAEPPYGPHSRSRKGQQIQTRHKLGHEIAIIAHCLPLCVLPGDAIGTAILFHPAERLNALPVSRSGEELLQVSGPAEFEDRLRIEFDDFQQGGEPMGVLWVSVDQGHNLRMTHGIAACHAMLEKVQYALAAGLRPSDELALWGEDEFLILTHERSAEMLSKHAASLAGIARTADFRWWGDRVSITVSIGAAQADHKQSLDQLLESARRAMENSVRTGGNRVSCALHLSGNAALTQEDSLCSPS